MDEFIKEAAANITSKITLYHDPLRWFTLKLWMYYLSLLVLIANLVWNLGILMTTNLPLHKLASSEDSSALVACINFLIYLFILVDMFVLSLTIISGFVANWTLKLNLYNFHGKMLIISFFSNFLIFYLDASFLSTILLRLVCYMYFKFLLSQIYGGVMYRVFRNIPDRFTRNSLLNEFNKLVDADNHNSFPTHRYGALYYRHSPM